jgi:hypothetical protein
LYGDVRQVEIPHPLQIADLDAERPSVDLVDQLRSCSSSGRAVRASYPRPATANQRRDSGSPPGLYESVATSMWQCWASTGPARWCSAPRTVEHARDHEHPDYRFGGPTGPPIG